MVVGVSGTESVATAFFHHDVLWLQHRAIVFTLSAVTLLIVKVIAHFVVEHVRQLLFESLALLCSEGFA